MLHSVIMAGGSGTRFWPLSRKACPKQFLTVAGERSLIQQAFDRCQPWIPPEQTWVVTTDSLAELTHEHLSAVPQHQILKEPAARNTAPCIGLAALCLLAVDAEATMLVMPADHVIKDVGLFEQDVAHAVNLVEEEPERLVLFGVPPSYPATGFGYIERGEHIGEHGADVVSFREKPDRDTAVSYLNAGEFLWNCGIFIWKAKRILEAISIHEPELAESLRLLKPHLGQVTWEAALAESYPKFKSISIDYAVLERESRIVVLEASFAWDDLGGWEALARLLPQDANGNSVVGLTGIVHSSDCIVRSSSEHLVTLLGMNNCIVVHTPDSTLVAQRGDDESIRQLIEALRQQGLERYL